MKFWIISVIALIIFSSISYSMTDAEFRDIMNQLNDKVEYLQSNIAQLKQELDERIGHSEDYILTEQQKMMVAYIQELEESLDPMSFSMPVITFILVIICLYCALLGTWWGRYHFFKSREDYYTELKEKQRKAEQAKDNKSENTTTPTPTEGIPKHDVYTQLDRERQYQGMIMNQRTEKSKGVIIAVFLVFIFILVFFLIILPLLS